jgi:hypothetical protein
MDCLAGVARVAGSIHINSIVLSLFLFSFVSLLFCYFVILVFSYFGIVLFSSFLFHPIRFVYLCIGIFAHFIFAYLHVFTNAATMNSRHSVRKMFHRTEMGMKLAKDF